MKKKVKFSHPRLLTPEPTPVAESIGIIQVGYGVVKIVIGTCKAIVWMINNI